jgi:hypothetical protein
MVTKRATANTLHPLTTQNRFFSKMAAWQQYLKSDQTEISHEYRQHIDTSSNEVRKIYVK